MSTTDSVRYLLEAIVVPSATGHQFIYHDHRWPMDSYKNRQANVLFLEAESLLNAGVPSIGMFWALA